MVANQALKPAFIAGEIAERFGVLQRELQRFDGMVETDQVQDTGKLPGGAQNGERIGCGAEADVPNGKRTGVMLEAFDQAKLANVQRLGFSDRPDNGVKRLAMRQRVDAVNAINEFDDLVTGARLH